ncbi:MAG: class I SAM-dependent methyltransferase [Cyanobium sp.]
MRAPTIGESFWLEGQVAVGGQAAEHRPESASTAEPAGPSNAGPGPDDLAQQPQGPAAADPDRAGYDQLVSALIPGYASLARLAVALLAASPLASAAGAAVLVAGCGTGAELLEARAQRPDWQLTGLDPSPAMLSLAQQRLDPAVAIHWRCCKVEEIGNDRLFDGALAVLVLQSLPDDGTKLGFLSALARLLRPGGQLVLVDLMRPERSSLQEQVAQAWLGFQRASGLEAAPGGGGEALGDTWHPIGPARLTALLDAAGFGDPALIFQALNFAGYLVQRRA